MKFEVKTDLNKKDFVAYYTLNQRLHAPAAYYFNKYGGVAALAVALLLTVVILTYRLWESRSVMIPYCIFVLLLIALPFANRFLIDRLFEANRSMCRGEYRFGDSGVETGDESAPRLYTYFSFCEFCRSGRAYYLYVDQNHAFVLPERSFTQGDPAAFGPFVEEKTGLKMKEIK